MGNQFDLIMQSLPNDLKDKLKNTLDRREVECQEIISKIGELLHGKLYSSGIDSLIFCVSNMIFNNSDPSDSVKEKAEFIEKQLEKIRKIFEILERNK